MNDDTKKQNQLTPEEQKKKEEYEKKLAENALDPTHNFAQMIGDPSGLTGITTDTNKKDSQELHKNDDNEHVSRSMSDFEYKRAMATAEGKDESEIKNPDPYSGDPIEEKTQNETLENPSSPSVQSEQAASSTMPDPASDDDTLQNEHDVGLQLDENIENPQPVDIASGHDKATEYDKEH